MDCVIVDLDGTLSDCSHRLHYIESGKKNWNAFFENCLEDKVIEPMFNLLKILSKHYAIVILTARPEKNRFLTTKWLQDNNIFYDVLLMRFDNDFSKPPLVKKKLLNNLINLGYNPVYSFDDRLDCFEMFRDAGVYSMQIPENGT